MKKILAVLLTLCFLLPMAVGCADQSENNPGTTESVPVSTPIAEDETSEKELDIKIPDGTNYGGIDFNYLYDTRVTNDFVVAEVNGEAINDAIYNRNLSVENRLGIKFNWIGKNGSWNVMDHTNAIESSVKSGLHEYDAISGELAVLMIIITNGYLLNVYDMPYIDLSAPWWNDKAASTLTVNENCFLALGDSSLTSYKNTFCMFFNKKVTADHNITGIYDMVNNNQWTLDQLVALSKDMYIDVNGDGISGLEDSFGFVSAYDNHMRNWMVALNTPIIQIDDSGLMEICFINDRTISGFEKLYDLYHAPSSNFSDTTISSPDAKNVPTIFTENRTLFMSGYLNTASLLRTTDCNFGIIPYPKYDEDQENYRTSVHNSVEMICFPTTLTNAKDIEKSSIVSEALAYEAWKSVSPLYCEIVLKYRNTTDYESAKMVELIMNSVLFDIGWCHSTALQNCGMVYEKCIKGNQKNISVYWRGLSKSVQSSLNDLNKAYQSMQ
ncbi:MAG: hypothetical protein MJ137_09580 [Clostridia bacterium]|nr:hypothetical protein [Clostridia bacterium]